MKYENRPCSSTNREPGDQATLLIRNADGNHQSVGHSELAAILAWLGLQVSKPRADRPALLIGATGLSAATADVKSKWPLGRFGWAALAQMANRVMTTPELCAVVRGPGY